MKKNNLTTDQKFGIALLIDLCLFFLMYLIYFEWGIAGWKLMLSITTFIGYNMFLMYMSLDHLDTQDKDMAMPLVTFVISAIALIIIVALVIAILFALIKGMRNGGEE